MVLGICIVLRILKLIGFMRMYWERDIIKRRIDNKEIEKYDIIYFNPPFEKSFGFIYCGIYYQIIFFDSTKDRKRLSNICYRML